MSRKPEYRVADFIVEWWSARAMSGELVSDEELMTLFEAARWAPSSYNNQPWRFIYAKRDTKHWETFFNLLDPFNQSWCKNAGALIVIASSKTFTDAVPNPAVIGKPSKTHSFDTGAAWENLAVQGTYDGLVIHAMEGFDYDKAKKDLNIPDRFTVEAMVAVGKPGDVKRLPEDLQQYEKMNDRKPVDQLVYEGAFDGEKD